ncbi:hypothetical protein [Haloarcula litorea]|uniref:hypothetical protein n=1 Tax=Haloarcula litorea TaxID=3032579 RepID=UPI0023E8ACEC|nr:hypothetical protein [Halomicroarcula sp. GDY20]
MSEHPCPQCRSDEYIESNTTNYAAIYYCSNCNQPFDPPAWVCPSCQETSPVSQSPLDDPWEYYCYDCDLAFNRLGPDTQIAESETEIDDAEDSTNSLMLTSEKDDDAPRGAHAYTITLRNVGTDSIRTQGRQPIALQYRVDESRWWTIYGNPERFTPPETVVLEPQQQLQWQITIHPHGVSGSDFSITHDPLPSGTYRFAYWGTPADDVAIGIHLPVDFENGW